MSWVADYSAARPGAAALKAAGAVGAMRYTGSLDKNSPAYRGDGVVIAADEVADFSAHGLPYGLVLEYEATWILRGYQSGLILAMAAKAYETSIGIPAGVTYAACDFDIGPSQYPQAYATLHGMADGYGGWQYVGVYGSKSFCEWVGANSPITKFWSTDAWSNYTPATNAALHQHANWPQGVPVVQGCDHNLILGDWAPRTMEDDLTPEQDNILRTCAKAIVQLGGAITTLQSNLSQLSQIVIHGDPTHYSLGQLGQDMKTLIAAVHAAPPGTVDPGLMTAVNAVGAKIDGLKLGVVA